MEAFTAKGRMRTLLEEIPVRVILNDKAALLGAARRAALSIGRERSWKRNIEFTSTTDARSMIETSTA